jgi:putative SOS response-associated peptidase YedK
MHDRMPVIIPAKDYDRWLWADPDRPPIDLLRPFDADKMTAWKVNKAVGNVKNDTPELIDTATDQIEDRAQDRGGLLFT